MFRVHHAVHTRYARPSLFALCLAFSLQAQAQNFSLNLPAQPLATSLSQVAQQTQVQLLFDETLLRNVQARALSGQFSPEDAIRQLLRDSAFTLVKVDNTFVVRASEVPVTEKGISLSAMSIVGDGAQVDSSSVGRSTLTQKDIDRRQPNNIPSLLATLPGVSMGGSPKPGGQTINIWGMGDAEDVPLTLNGAPKSGFERYQQGTIFIEPELIKSIEVEKGPHSPFTGNGGFGGTVNMITKDAPDLLEPGKDAGAMLKYGYSSNEHAQIYTGAVYGRTDNGMFDALAYFTKRDTDDLKLADTRPVSSTVTYPINPQRLPNTSQNLDGELFKLNFHPNDEHSVGLSYTRSKSFYVTPFSANTYPVPPNANSIRQYGYEGALRRLVADRDTVDTTWSGEYLYQPVDNPLVDLKLTYSHSKTEQTDERDDTAFMQPTSGGKELNTSYADDVFEVRNTSLFETGPLAHALTVGTQLRKHKRDVLMYMPGSDATYNYGLYQPYFMPRGKVDSQAAYVKDAVTIGDVTITPSLRFDQIRNDGKPNYAPRYSVAGVHDYSSQTYSGWSPRLSVFWTVTPMLGLFADYSKTWRAPVIDEQYEVQSAGSTRSTTSRNLDPERITALRTGSVVSLDKLIVSSDSLQIRTTLFRNEIKDEIFKNIGTDCANQSANGGSVTSACGTFNRPIYRNIGGSTIQGFEVESFYNSDWLFASVSYSYIEGKHEGAYLNPWGPDAWARDISAPKWVTTLGTNIPPLDMQVGLQSEFVRKTDRFPGDTWSADGTYNARANERYDVHSLFASWKPRQAGLKGTEVNLTVDNLFNTNYIPVLSGDGVYSQGRNAKVSVTRFF